MLSPVESTVPALAAAYAAATSPQPLLTCSLPTGSILSVNRAAASLLGRPAEQLVGQPLASALGEASLVWHDRDDPPVSSLRLPSGQVAELACSVVPNSGGALGLARFTLPRPDLVELLLNAIEDFVGVVSVDGERLFVSPTFYRAAGYTPEEIATSDYRTRVHPDDLELVEKTRAANLRGERTRIEYRCRRKDGSFLWLDLRATPLSGADGRIERIVWASRDVGERKLLEQELRDSRRFIEQVADAMPQMLFVYDLTQQQYVWVNAQCKAVCGVTPGELLRMKPGESIEQVHPDDRLGSEEIMRRLTAAPEGAVVEMDYRISHPERGWRRLRTRCLVFRFGADGRPAQILGVSEDVTAEP